MLEVDNMVADIRLDERIKVWFSNREFAEKTRDAYAIYMQLFCECINKTPSEIVLEANIETRNGLLLNERKVVQYFAAFKDCLKNRGYADKTQGIATSAVKSFYMFYDIQVSGQVGKSKQRHPKKENQRFLKLDDVKKLLTAAGTLRDKAIILVMATGGVARREILDMKIKDITLNDESGVGILSIRREKVQSDYTTFISPEAVEMLNAYFDERNRTPELKIKGSNDYVFVTYRSGYRFTAGTQIGDREFSMIFRLLGKELGYINDTGWSDSRSHSLRKYFTSTLENAGVPKFKVDFMAGHVPDGVDQAYYNQDIDKLKELYVKNVEYLAINRELVARTIENADVRKMKQLEADNQMIDLKLLEKDREIQALRGQIADRDQKLDALSMRVENMSQLNEQQIKDKFDEMFARNASPLMKRLMKSQKEIDDVMKIDLFSNRKGSEKKVTEKKIKK